MFYKSFLITFSLFFMPLLCRAGLVDTSDVVWQKNLSVNCYCLAFSPDSRLLAAGCQVVTYIWDVSTGNLVHTIIPSSTTNALAFSPDGKYLAVGGDYIKIWDTKTWDSINVIKNAGGGIGNMQFTHDGTKLVTTAYQAGLTIYDTQNWNLIKRIDSFPYLKDPKTGAGSPNAEFISISYDDRYIAFSGYSGDWTFLYDFTVDSIVKQIGGSIGAKFSPVKNELVYYYYDSWPNKPTKGLTYYKLDTGDSTYIDVSNVNDFAFSPDGNYISMANEIYTIQTWSLLTNELIYTYNYYAGPHKHVTNSPNGLYIGSSAISDEFLLYARWTPTGISENDPEINALKVSPNPTKTGLNIEFNLKTSGITEIEIIDISGQTSKIIYPSFFEEGKHQYNFNTQYLSNGEYTIRLIQGNNIKTTKLIIAK